jgi:hypothetical protein
MVVYARDVGIQEWTCGINHMFRKLITALRTAVENREGVLDKEATNHDDLFDAFRLSLQFWH